MAATDMFRVSESLVLALDLDSRTQTRNQIVTAIMNYVKEHDLIDSQNKMVYRTDGLLTWLMNGKQITSAFSAIRDLEDHLEKLGDDETEEEEEEEEEEEQEEEEEDKPQWYRELTLQNEDRKTLNFKFVRGHSQSVLTIQGFEMDHEEFMEYYVRLTGENPWDDTGAMNLLWLFLVVGGLTMFSLWLSLYNQSSLLIPGC